LKLLLEVSSEGSPRIGILCEFDALPDIGHGCGHNLIAELGMAAGVALKAVLESTDLRGTVVVLGTPGEEGGGGKILLMRNGAFDDLDMVMIAHPSPVNTVRPLFDAVKELKVTYKYQPEDRASFVDNQAALDAAVMAYNSVSVLRQQMKPSWRVQMIISKGGVTPGVVPRQTEVSTYIKAPNVSELENLEGGVRGCFESAGIATGCSVTISQPNFTHENIKHSAPLSEVFFIQL